MEPAPKSMSSFQLKGDSQQFADRQKSLFDKLDILEKSCLLRTEPQRNNDTYVIGSNSRRSETKPFRGRESIFKRPEAPISKCLPAGRTPGFRKSPQKWTKYTLNDVKDEDMSERSNTAAAMSFLRELEGRKSDEEDAEQQPAKITFKKTALIKRCDENADEIKATFRNSKVVMPEYVVGQKKAKKTIKTKEKLSCSGAKQLKLDHLLDADEED